MARVRETTLRAYRWQYIISGAEDERFGSMLADMIDDEQAVRIRNALTPIAEGLERV
jgi:hypothetical protein